MKGPPVIFNKIYTFRKIYTQKSIKIFWLCSAILKISLCWLEDKRNKGVVFVFLTTKEKGWEKKKKILNHVISLFSELLSFFLAATVPSPWWVTALLPLLESLELISITLIISSSANVKAMSDAKQYSEA